MLLSKSDPVFATEVSHNTLDGINQQFMTDVGAVSSHRSGAPVILCLTVQTDRPQAFSFVQVGDLYAEKRHTSPLAASTQNRPGRLSNGA